MAATLVGAPGAAVSADAPASLGSALPESAGPSPRFDALLRMPFYKMSGSGNDFVFFDARQGGTPDTVDTARLAELCARGTGVGADGVVFLDQPGPGPGRVRIAYYNSDGSRAALCGNATLCAANLAVHLGAVAAATPFVIDTDSGELEAIVDPAAGASVVLGTVRELVSDADDALVVEAPGCERRVGSATAGVPHVVVRVDNVGAVDLAVRGPALRRATQARPEGANVNYVSPAGDGTWVLRTFERGVEGETLACGTGAVAAAALLRAWGEVGRRVVLHTRSGRPLTVSLDSTTARPRLSGEGRLVFSGRLELP